MLDHTFCVEHNAFGRILQHELKPNGRNVPVTEENKKEYVRYCCGRPGLGEGGAEMAEARGPSPCDQPGSSRRASQKPLGPTGRAPSAGAPASPSPGGRAVTGRSRPQHCGEVSRDRAAPGGRRKPGRFLEISLGEAYALFSRLLRPGSAQSPAWEVYGHGRVCGQAARLQLVCGSHRGLCVIYSGFEVMAPVAGQPRFYVQATKQNV